MALTNRHGIRHKAKGGGKKWRPSPNDPALAAAKPPKPRTDWKGSVGDVFRGKRR